MALKSKVKTVKAWAKVNLTLEVIGRRKDGYHEIKSVVQAISLCDTLSFQLREDISLECNVPELASSDNLVVRAAKLLQEATGSSKGAHISLSKGIPWGSGLGGGSSDAAATLLALNVLWGLNLPSQKMQEIAAKLGSDIFFFLHGGRTSLVEGRGEKVTPLPPLPKSWVILMKPPISMPSKTERMYASLNLSHFTTGEFTERMIELIRRADKITPSLCYNVFENVAFSFFPGLEEYRQRFLDAGVTQIHLAGAGPTLFTFATKRAQGEEICRKLWRGGVEVYMAETL